MKTHRGQNSKQINIAEYNSKFLMYGAKMSDKCVKSKKNCTLSFFAKASLEKWHPLKQTKSKNRQHFSNPIFHDKYTTLLLVQQRFLKPKGPKNEICLWLSGKNIADLTYNVLFCHSAQRQSTS